MGVWSGKRKMWEVEVGVGRCECVGEGRCGSMGGVSWGGECGIPCCSVDCAGSVPINASGSY